MSQFIVRKVAVLGAGVMGAQIAAHLVNAKVAVMLYDLPAKDGDKSGIAKKAIEGAEEDQPGAAGPPGPGRRSSSRRTTRSTSSSCAASTS